MAKQVGNVFIRGTVDDLTYYTMGGKYYVRMKSSLTGKKFWKSKAFEGSRRSCRRFGEGNRLASKLYRKLEVTKRKYKLFCFLKKRAIQLLKMGKSRVEAEEILMDVLIDFGLVGSKRRQGVTRKRTNHFARREMNYYGRHSETRVTVKRLKRLREGTLIYSVPGKPRGPDAALAGAEQGIDIRSV